MNDPVSDELYQVEILRLARRAAELEQEGKQIKSAIAETTAQRALLAAARSRYRQAAILYHAAAREVPAGYDEQRDRYLTAEVEMEHLAYRAATKT
jgi:hypothetical protein